MADFHQNGIVTTLHNLTERSVDDLETQLVRYSKRRPVGLVLPSLFSELEGPALGSILDHLEHVPYLTEIVIGLDRADEGQYRHALAYFDRLPQHHRVLWHDGPRLRAIDRQLADVGLAPPEPGKGRNVWYCYGYMLGTRRSEAIALHDCDVLTYDRRLLARLVYPVANPTLSYEFCKGFYARVGNEKLNGRVSRLLVTPLIRALKAICGPSEYLDFLDSFRYPLAGEFSIRRDVLLDLRIPSDWGLEVGVLSEMFRNYATNRICQVDIADRYDHKHQELSIDDKARGLSRMSLDICKSIFRKLATQGYTFTAGGFRSLKATYYRIALDFVDSYRNDALINGLSFDQHKEELAVELFSRNIVVAGQSYLESPMEMPFIPAWNRVMSAFPDILEQLTEAVEEDAREFGR